MCTRVLAGVRVRACASPYVRACVRACVLACVCVCMSVPAHTRARVIVRVFLRAGVCGGCHQMSCVSLPRCDLCG